MKKIIRSAFIVAAVLAASSAFAFSSSLDFQTVLKPGQTYDLPLGGLYEKTVYNMICNFDIDHSDANKDEASTASISRHDAVVEAPDNAPMFSAQGGPRHRLFQGTTINFNIKPDGVATSVNGIVKGVKFAVKSLDYSNSLIVKCNAYPVG